MGMNAEQMRLLASKGLTFDEILEFMELQECRSDRTNAERQARYRKRRDVSVEEWERLRLAVFERDGFACTYCGSQEDLACDHVVPLIQDGKSTLDNLTTACKPCNSGKSGRTVEEWLGDDA